MHEYEQRVIEDHAIPFRNGSELPDEIGELLHMPAADIAQDALALRSGSSRRLSVFMCVIVMTCCRMSQRREARQALALGQHVAGDTGLPGRQSISQQIALNLGDARPVLHL